MYYAGSVGDPRGLSIRVLTLRLREFLKVHKQEMRTRIILAGGKPKG